MSVLHEMINPYDCDDDKTRIFDNLRSNNLTNDDVQF